MRFLLACAALAVIFVTTAAAQPSIEVGERAPAFDMKDQFGKIWKLPDLKERVVVLVVATTDSGRLMGPWVDTLKAQYADKVTILGLLDLKSVPSIGRGIAKSRIRKETKDPMMLDFSGRTAQTYGVSGKVPTVVVIDKNGLIQAIARQTYSKSAYESVSSVIGKSLK
ncbi:MAG: peroxiredoxin family protein [Armatimonadota bacterium]|jgi:predicted transcriptional regulator